MDLHNEYFSDVTYNPGEYKKSSHLELALAITSNWLVELRIALYCSDLRNDRYDYKHLSGTQRTFRRVSKGIAFQIAHEIICRQPNASTRYEIVGPGGRTVIEVGCNGVQYQVGCCNLWLLYLFGSTWYKELSY
jgi:hypothetical protein